MKKKNQQRTKSQAWSGSKLFDWRLVDFERILADSIFFFRNFPAYTELMLSEWPNTPFSHSYDIYPRNSDTKMSLNTLIILKFDLVHWTAYELWATNFTPWSDCSFIWLLCCFLNIDSLHSWNFFVGCWFFQNWIFQKKKKKIRSTTSV